MSGDLRTLQGRDDSLQLQEEDILQVLRHAYLKIGRIVFLDDLHSQEGWDVDEMADLMKTMRITGQEASGSMSQNLVSGAMGHGQVWLDCLLVALEEEASHD